MAYVYTCDAPAPDGSCPAGAVWVQQETSFLGASLSVDDASLLAVSIGLVLVVAWGFRQLRRVIEQ